MWIFECDHCDTILKLEFVPRDTSIQLARNYGWSVNEFKHSCFCKNCADELSIAERKLILNNI